MRAAELDAVTVDAYGTLLTVFDPVSSLHELLPTHEPQSIERAFHAESAYYREHSSEGNGEQELALLHERSVAVFNDALGSSLSPAAYTGAFRFELLPGVADALRRLRALGLALAVVANWDITLHTRLEEAGIASFFAAVVPAAAKPDAQGILRALELLHVRPERALHVGDAEADERAARAAGVRYLPTPLAEAVATLV